MKRTPCSCGRPFALIDGIEGRTEDVLSFPTAAGKETVINPLVFHCIMDIVPASGWQIVQEDSGLRVLLSGVREGFAEGTLIDALWQALQAQGAIVPPIQVQRVATIPRGTTGKVPLIKSTHSSTTPSPRMAASCSAA